MASNTITVRGVGGLVPTGNDWFLVKDPGLVECYAPHLLNEPGVRVRSRESDGRPLELEIHLTHLPLLPGWEAEPLPDIEKPAHLSSEWWALLHPYQRSGAAFARMRVGTLLADDLGLGKSRTALAAADPPILILCPKTAIEVWMYECEVAGLTYHVLSGESVAISQFQNRDTHAWIIPYSVCGCWAPYFSVTGMGPRCHTLICDEGHEMQNQRVTVYRTVKSITFRRALILTATPIRNRLRSFWALLDALAFGRPWGSQAIFRLTYCGAEQTMYGLADAVPSDFAMERLIRRLQEVLIRRTREGVEHIVPPIERRRIELPISCGEISLILEDTRAAIRDKFWSAGTKSGRHLTALTRLRRSLGRVKANRVMWFLPDILRCHKHVVIWCWHQDTVSILRKQIEKDGYEVDVLVGATGSKERQRIAALWRSGLTPDSPPRVLISTLAAGSTAVSYTAAEAEVFVEYDYAPLHVIQAEKRVHRFGQRHEKVFAYYVYVPQTIDEKIAQVLLDKAKESDRVIASQAERRQLAFLLGRSEDSSQRQFMADLRARLTGEENGTAQSESR